MCVYVYGGRWKERRVDIRPKAVLSPDTRRTYTLRCAYMSVKWKKIFDLLRRNEQRPIAPLSEFLEVHVDISIIKRMWWRAADNMRVYRRSLIRIFKWLDWIHKKYISTHGLPCSRLWSIFIHSLRREFLRSPPSLVRFVCLVYFNNIYPT